MRSILLSSVCLIALAGCGSPDPIVFGHLDPKGTHDSEYRALKLAVDATNEDPAKRPFERRVHVIHADAGQTPEQLKGQAVRLAAVNRVFALIGGDTAREAELIGQAAQGDVLAITMSGWPGSPVNPNLFPVGLAPAEIGRCLAQHATERFKDKSITVLVDDTSPVHKSIADAFVNKYEKATRVTAISRRSSGTKEANTAAENELAERVRKAKPDVLFFAMSGIDALSWSRSLGIMKGGVFEPLTTNVLFAGEEADLPRLQEQPEITGGWIAAAAIAPDEDAEPYKLFKERYRKQYERDPDTAAVLVHDAYQVLVQACKRASDATGPKVREEFKKKDASFDVLSGKLTFAPDQSARRPVYVVQLGKDGLKRLQRNEPVADAAPAPK